MSGKVSAAKNTAKTAKTPAKPTEKPAEKPTEKPTTDDNSKTDADEKVEDVWDGVPLSFKNDPCYFRHINIDDITMIVDKPLSTFSKHNITLVFKKDLEGNKGKDKNKKVRSIRVTGPPLRIRWPSLHGAGDYTTPWNKGIEKQTLGAANFNVILHEGDIPEDLVKVFPAIEREQKAFFEWLKVLDTKVTQMLFDHDEVQKEKKDEFRETVCSLSNSAPEDPKTQTEVKRMFFKNANVYQGRKTPISREPNERIPNPWMLMKKPISTKKDQNKSFRFKPTGIKQDEQKHYIDALMENNPPKDYNPPLIISKKGKKIDLGDNSIQLLFSKDICIPTFYPKAYDAGSYGLRLVYGSLQVIRKRADNEIDDGNVDHSDLFCEGDEDDDDDDLRSRGSLAGAKRKAEDNASDAAKKAKTEGSEEGDKSKGEPENKKRKVDETAPASNKKAKAEPSVADLLDQEAENLDDS